MIGGEDHVAVVSGVDPQIVVIAAAGRAHVGLPGFAGVGGTIERSLGGEEDVWVARVDDDVVELAATDEARVVGCARPMLAAVVGTEHALGDVVVDAQAIAAGGDGERDDSEVATGQSGGASLLPGDAFVGGAIDLRIGCGRGYGSGSAAATATTAAATTAGACAGIHVVRVIGVEDEPHGAGLRIGQNGRPRLAAIGSAHHAGIARGGDDDIGVMGIDDDGSDCVAFERDAVPLRAGVGGAV